MKRALGAAIGLALGLTTAASAADPPRLDRGAFSQPSASLPLEDGAAFAAGNGLFRRTWVTAPTTTQSADGLGPLFNARSCQDCHLQGGRGHPPQANERAMSMFLRLSVPPVSDNDKLKLASGRALAIDEPTYGSQLQPLSIAGQKAEGRMAISYTDVPVRLAGGEVVHLRKPSYGVANLAFGPMRPDTMMSPRVAPPMIGLGLLEAVSDEDILAQADPDDRDGNGIRGRPNEVWSDVAQKVSLGRFGWKAGRPSLMDQSAAALAIDIGIGNPLHPAPWGDCTQAEIACRAGPHGTDEDGFEASRQVLDLIVFYLRNLAVPAPREAGDPTVLRGKALFEQAGCAACHTPSFTTRAGQRISPYSDLLLHDMGEGLADHRPEGRADGRDWRTQPLWGLGYTQAVSGHTQLLHDGRARSVTEAILWHGGEAQKSREAFASMTKQDRDAVVAFLNSL